MKKFVLIAVTALFAYAFALDAAVVSVTGRVEVQEGSVWVKLQKGDKVPKGSVISTGFKSEAVLSVKGATLTLGPLTRMTVQQLMEGEQTDSTELFIDSGKIAADVNPTDGKRMGFKVRSPIATASVRGTKFSVTSGGKLSVDRGVVSYGPPEAVSAEGEESSSEAAAIPVAGGQSSQAAADGSRSTPAQEKSVAAAGASSDTVSLAASESVTTGAAASSAASAADSGTTAFSNIIVNVRFPE